MTNPFTDLLNIATHLLTKDLREKKKARRRRNGCISTKRKFNKF